MTMRCYKTAVIGFGKMGSGYASDPLMARYFPFSTHAQVLANHDGFEWIAVVDPNIEAQTSAQNEWSIPNVASSITELGELAKDVEVAVIATPPDTRITVLDHLPNLRGVLVEKPLGLDSVGARKFLDECRSREIHVQVNIWRRADEVFRALANGVLRERIGEPQAVNFYYGNGLLNNGTHMVDFSRMLFGNVRSIQKIGSEQPLIEGPIPGDINPSFVLNFTQGVSANFNPLCFSNYRENGVIIWGRHGRFDILNEGLTLCYFPLKENRAMSGEREIAADIPESFSSTVGTALYRMYSNLMEALCGTTDLYSPGDSALLTSQVIDTIMSAPESGEVCMLKINEFND